MPRPKRKVSTDPAAFQLADEAKNKRTTRNSVAAPDSNSAGTETVGLLRSNPVAISDENDSDFDDLSDSGMPISQLSAIEDSQIPDSQLDLEPEPAVANVVPVTPASVHRANVVPVTPASVHPSINNPLMRPLGRTPSYAPITPSTPSPQEGGSMHIGNLMHPDFLKDVASAAHDDAQIHRQNIRGVLNFHLKALFLAKRNISAADRKLMVQHAISKANINTVELAAFNKHIDNHHSYLLRQLRGQFQAALRMFLDHPLAQNWVNHITTGIENWGQTHDGKRPVLAPAALDRMFLLNDMHLVWDIWAPILDCVPNYEALTTGAGMSWGQALRDSTLTVLAWMITHHFYPVNQDKTNELTTE
jgi:hypothetical protein